MSADAGPRRGRRRIAVAIAAAVLVVAVVALAVRDGSTDRSGTPSRAELRHLRHVDGQVLQATSTRVVMEQSDGAPITLDPGPLEQATLEHLAEHARIGIGTRVWVRRDGSRLDAVAIRDLRSFPGVERAPARPVAPSLAARVDDGDTQADVLRLLGVPRSLTFEARSDCWSWPMASKGTFEVCFDRRSPAPVTSTRVSSSTG
jgi:hypothetical protein